MPSLAPISGTPIASVPAGGVFVADITELMTSSDMNASGAGTMVDAQEFASASDAADATSGTSPSHVDAVTMSTEHSSVALMAAQGTILEPANASDFSAAGIAYSGDLIELITVTENSDGVTADNLLVDCDETMLAGDAATGAMNAPVNAVEVTTAIDATNASTSKVVIRLESLTAVESSTAKGNSIVGIIEVATAAVAIDGLKAGSGSIIEAGTAIEASTSSPTLLRTLTESGAAVDLIVALLAVSVSVIEPTSATESSSPLHATSGSVVEQASADSAQSSAQDDTADVSEAAVGADRTSAGINAAVDITEATTALDSEDAALQLHWQVHADELATAMDTEDGSIPFGALMMERALASDRSLVLDVSGYVPGNITWRVPARQHVWSLPDPRRTRSQGVIRAVQPMLPPLPPPPSTVVVVAEPVQIILPPVTPLPPVMSGDKFDRYVQAVAASVWTIDHNFNKYPSVTVIDSAGDECEGEVRYLSPNTIQLVFSSAFAGTAYLN